MVLGIALYEVLLLIIGLPLGLTHHLTSQYYVIFTWCAAIPLAAQSWKNGIRLDPAHALRWLRTRRGTAVLLLATFMAAAFALQLGFDAFYGTRHYDGLSYHIPRVMFWLDHQSFAAWTTPAWAQVGLPVGADVILVLAIAICISSYWPVYVAFSDFQGGDFGRAHKVGTVTEFTHAVAMSTGHWLLEPLGYITPFKEDWVKGVSKTVYNFLGAHLEKLPESWKPWPAQDVGRTGLTSVLLLPALLIGLSPRARKPAIAIFLLGFISLSGMVHFQAWGTRYHIVLLAGFALLWGSTRFFQRGKRRWVLTGIVTLNVCALLGVIAIRFFVDTTSKSKPGGSYYYLSEEDRHTIAGTLSGHPLQVVTNDTLDALLVGPGIDYSLSYIICPADGDWNREMRNAALKSNWLAIVHEGKTQILTGPTGWHRPGEHTCPEISTLTLENALSRSGWQLYRRTPIVDLWRVL